jgi:YD repeat-containing protein
VVTTTDGTQYDVSVADGLQVITDRFGNTITLDEGGITASLGPDLTWERDGQGRITAITFPDASEVEYAYTVAGDLDIVTDQLEYDTEHVYEDDHRLTSYNGEGRPAAAVWTYDEEGRVVATEDGEGVGTALDMDGFDPTELTVAEVGPDPDLTTVFTYDADGLLSSMVQSWPSSVDPAYDAGSYETTYTYDAEYRVASVTHPSGGTETFAYDGAGRVTRHVDAADVETTRVYHALGAVLEERRNGALREARTVNADGMELTRTDAMGHTTTMTWDSGGRP